MPASASLVREKPEKPLRAYAVCEHDERTGAIYFARHAIVARRIGANEHGDGELSYVTCTRAPWADRYAAEGDVPASVMVMNGWHFECTGCGRRIDEGMPYLWENEVMAGEPLNGANLRYAKWKPSHVIGTQHGLVFCRASCEADFNREQAAKKHVGDRAIARFERVITRRFPDAVIERKDYLRPHVYVMRDQQDRLIVEQVAVSFSFPGQVIAPATLRMDTTTDWQPGGKSVRRALNNYVTRIVSGDQPAAAS